MGSQPAQPPQESVAQRAERRMSTPSDAGSPPQVGETAEMRERRRKQNRLAQQAFRARQKVRVEALEAEWARLRQLHEALNHACSQRAQEIEHLHSRVEELLQDIEFLKSSQELERGWPPSPSASSSASSSSASSSSSVYEQQSASAQTYQRMASQFDLASYLGKGGFSEFPEFPLNADWIQGMSR
ncbi:hypothetical protein G647_01033 [Cladophialophora carrionii CBS 160.54]|uniref:BZIP domain-containing protein n=1 Tax=Cladophialophora carrionii CBS 160.54 TaxID=1279043 RepID=V9DQJ3_9EURO|nr:uncharacterized protein G647_01033 [Cladophialophora carrionii CBS 160.54]ETI28583.1 hypothetical protein G647_01033 [Cladophialophora carrionii CBS 160.54]